MKRGHEAGCGPTSAFLVLCAALLLGPGAAAWAADSPTCRIWGQVTDTAGEPVAGVRITCTGGLPQQVTDMFGKYEVRAPDKVVQYTLTASKDGWSFAPASESVWISGSDVEASFTGKPIEAAPPIVRLATVSTPRFTPPAPATFVNFVQVSISCDTADATIRYTTDGTNPTGASTIYTGQLTLTGTTTLKAQAFKSGMLDSLILTGTYTQQTVAKPVFVPAAPLTFTGSVAVTILCATPGATIRYTTDGTDPTPVSPLYAAALSLTDTTTLKARGFLGGVPDSPVASGTYTEQPVATPTFLPAAPYTFLASVQVAISCATTGATIRYTTDGTDPNALSTIYSTPLTFTGTTTLKARAFRADMPDSLVATGVYTQQPVATPVFVPVAPHMFVNSENVQVFCATAGATVRYTTDGTDPTGASTPYTTPLTFTDTTTLKARAFKVGMPDSAIATGVYTRQPVATPTFSPGPRTFTGSVDVRISCATGGATIRYTTDGTDPTGASTSYTTALTFTDTTTLKAKAFKAGVPDSAIASATYTRQTVETPTFSPLAPYAFIGSVKVRISCATGGATIRYTTDGTDPTGASTVYTTQLTFFATTTVKAKAFKAGMTDSAVGTGVFTMQTVATPTFSPVAPATFTTTKKVTIKCATSGVTIRYTTDGTDPTGASTLYSGSIVLSATTTIKAKAFKAGMLDSAIATGVYTKL